MKPIRVWQYKDAPKKYRRIMCEDDADWLALVPYGYGSVWWLQTEAFGCCSVDTEEVKEGVIYVGYHA